MPFWNKKRKQNESLEVCTKAELVHLKVTCPRCKKVYTGNEAYEHLYICPECGKYMPIGAKERLMMVLDPATFEPWFEDVVTTDPLRTAG